MNIARRCLYVIGACFLVTAIGFHVAGTALAVAGRWFGRKADPL